MPDFSLLPGVTVTAYGLWVALGAALCGGFSLLFAPRFRARRDALYAALVLALALGWLLSRVFFVLGQLPYYLQEIQQPDKMLLFWHGGYSMSGALVGAALGCLLAARLARVSVLPLWDALAACLPLFLLCERYAERFTALGLGRSVQLRWLWPSAFCTIVTADGYHFHNVRHYELAAGAALLALAVLFLARPPQKRGEAARRLSACFCALQVVWESLRSDGHMTLGFVHVQQMIYFLVLLCFAGARVRRAFLLRAPRAAFVSLALTALCSALCVALEFRADASPRLWLVYLGMAACLAVLCGIALWNPDASLPGFIAKDAQTHDQSI